jgi:hypothetical protein
LPSALLGAIIAVSLPWFQGSSTVWTPANITANKFTIQLNTNSFCILRIDQLFQADVGSRWQYRPLEISAALPFLHFADIRKYAAAVMIIEVGTARHPVFWV